MQVAPPLDQIGPLAMPRMFCKFEVDDFQESYRHF